MSKRVAQYKSDLQRAGKELMELLDLVKHASPDKGFEKRDGGIFTDHGLTKTKVAQLKESERNNLSLSNQEKESLAAYNQAMSNIDTKIEELKQIIQNLNDYLNQDGDLFEQKIQACYDAIIAARGYDSNADKKVLSDHMSSANLRKDDLMDFWEQVDIYFTQAMRGFFRLFDEVQSLVTKKVMNDTRETSGACEIRELFSLESRSQFFPKPLLSIDDAICEWMIASNNLRESLTHEADTSSKLKT